MNKVDWVFLYDFDGFVSYSIIILYVGVFFDYDFIFCFY